MTSSLAEKQPERRLSRIAAVGARPAEGRAGSVASGAKPRVKRLECAHRALSHCLLAGNMYFQQLGSFIYALQACNSF